MAKVLVVDDDADDLTLISGLLAKRGDQCQTLQDGLQALNGAKSFRPDVILLDIVMPGQDGYATCRQLKRDPETKNIPVLFISGRTSETDQFWGKKIGAVRYLCKPFSSDELYEAVDFALNSRTATD